MNLLCLERIKIQNANALSSPYTIGFPSMSAWLGFMHALQRKLNQAGLIGLELDSIGVISHQFNLHTYKGEGDFVSSIIATGNPLDKDGSRPAFIEAARCDLTVSLLIEFYLEDSNNTVLNEDAIKIINNIIPTMKIASGDVIQFVKLDVNKNIYYLEGRESDEDYISKMTNKITRSLMPGYALIERRDLMKIEMQENQCDALDAVLNYLAVEHKSEIENDNVNWNISKKTEGWIVPISIGFQGITELKNAKDQRDPDILHCFAESVLTLGEFRMVYRFNNLLNLLWEYDSREESLNQNLYLCKQVEENY